MIGVGSLLDAFLRGKKLDEEDYEEFVKNKKQDEENIKMIKKKLWIFGELLKILQKKLSYCTKNKQIKNDIKSYPKINATIPANVHEAPYHI